MAAYSHNTIMSCISWVRFFEFRCYATKFSVASQFSVASHDVTERDVAAARTWAESRGKDAQLLAQEAADLLMGPPACRVEQGGPSMVKCGVCPIYGPCPVMRQP
jgi:hypothetical protein